MNEFQRDMQIGLVFAKEALKAVYDEHFDLLTDKECEGFMICFNAYKEKLRELIDAN